MLVQKHFQYPCWYTDCDSRIAHTLQGDTCAHVEEQPVELLQAHDENIFGESGEALKNVAVL